ncbi:DUF4212 domain-containing protein [Noviherbaspirillum cavernae]|uniref:DUF4212 domain-containing protein n=1 Tax=Noviherbaspirillum cavernae TaxID=2320862 RepID=A0A418WY94_9BURK|nr:DUF4212 domain-containing protein [Noviherbaspirillum cavernae]RJG05200.1 DUF4212 domain-containing protein [Noviherbaspirillum cavernae]
MRLESGKTIKLDRVQHWKRTRRLTSILLCVWFVVTFGVAWYARALSGIQLFGWSFSYYMAAQGIILVYIAIIGLYTWRMSKLDRLLEGEDADGK